MPDQNHNEVNVAVLGRGYSLCLYTVFAKFFQTVYVVNFREEFKALGLDHFEGKHIVYLITKPDCPEGIENVVSEVSTVNYKSNWPTLGLVALETAIKETNATNICLFGIDCYRTPYLCPGPDKQRQRALREDELGEERSRMIPFMRDLALKYPSIRFFTSSREYEIDAQNFSYIDEFKY